MQATPTRLVCGNRVRPLTSKLSHRSSRSNGRQVIPRCSASASNSEFAKKAQDFVKEAQQKATQFAEQSKLQDKAKGFARQASQKFTQTYETVEEQVKSTASRLDREYDISKKAERAGKRLEESAREVDSRYGVRNKLRGFVEDVQRKWPKWKRQLEEFWATPLGQVAALAALAWMFYTGAIFYILNWLLLLWWLAPLFVVPLLRYINKQQMEELERQAREEEARRAAANPFAAFGRGFPGATGGGTGKRSQGGSQQGKRKSYAQQDGPVVDAEWTSIDDGK